jgi:hypothetical protein
MGNIHTKRRARLGHNEVFDTAVVRMDLKRKQAADGLTRAHLQRQLGGPSVLDAELNSNTETSTDQHDETAEEMAENDSLGDYPAASDITALAARLRQEVIDDVDPPEDEGVESLSLSQSSVQQPGILPQRVGLFFGTQEAILLGDLFNYEALEPEGQGLDIFRHNGLANLTKVLEIFELATREKHPDTVSADVNT